MDNLRGKAAGVNIFSNSSQPGAYGSRVVIRGKATINASSNPLYVVDGVVMENFDLMNPNDIESMEVLKDASATAIYGARGANGVVMVTTKRGNKKGEGRFISYAGSVSEASRSRKDGSNELTGVV
ncbi:TonB-dependent receptor plug domain-containing protein [Parabacteroides distasonis]|nr:TonB-dependent receptor plug domain-containing protein [Parabacteroides distasonis]